MNRVAKIGIIGLLCISFGLSPLMLYAAPSSFTLSPVIVDEKAKPRDILKQMAVVTNNTERKVTLYVTVKDVDQNEGEQEFQNRYESEVETSLAHWIEITRGQIELEPGETKRIPYLIQVHLNAQPGVYHANIFFQEGSNRGEAQMRRKTWHAIDVNIEVLDNAREQLQLAQFIPDNVFFTGDTASFSYLLENIGNRSLAPDGEIRIFNRKGEEVASLPANAEEVSLLPEATSQLAATWDTGGQFGRYKAYLDVQYGNKQRGSVTDTIFFWVIPWKQIMLIFFTLAGLIAITAYIVYDRYGFNRKVAATYSYADELHDDEECVPQYATSATGAVTLSKKRSIQKPAQKTSSASQNHGARSPIRRQSASVSGAAVTLGSRKKPQPPHGSVLSLKKK